MLYEIPIHRILLDAEEQFANCNLHFELVGDARNLSRLYTSEELDPQYFLERLALLTSKIPDDCRDCSQVASDMYGIEQKLRAGIPVPINSQTHGVKIPSKSLLRTRTKSNYPFPIAISYSQACELDDDVRINIHKIIDTFEFSFRYCVYILLEYVSGYTQKDISKNILGSMLKNLNRVSLGFETGLGGILVRIRDNFEIQNTHLRDLSESIYKIQEYIKKLVDVRNRISHRVGLYLSQFIPDDIIQNFSEVEDALEKFLWTIQVISKMPLIY